MNHILCRANIFSRYNSKILFDQGRPSRRQWHSSFISLSRVMHQHICGIRFDQTQSKNPIAVKTRKIGYENKLFFNSNQGNIWSLITNQKCSSFGGRKFFTTKNFQNVHPEKRRRLLSAVFRSLKNISLITGIIVWIFLVLYFCLVDNLKVENIDMWEVFPSERWATMRSLKFLGIDEEDGNKIFGIDSDFDSDDANEVKVEIIRKVNAVKAIWQVMKEQALLQVSIGNSIDIFAYKCCGVKENLPWNINNDERETKWTANCYIEGSTGKAILSILFERHNKKSDWVPTKVHIEEVKESGEIICNISSGLPNGLRNFTRFSDP